MKRALLFVLLAACAPLDGLSEPEKPKGGRCDASKPFTKQAAVADTTVAGSASRR